MSRVELPPVAEVDYAIKAHHRFLSARGLTFVDENDAFDVPVESEDEIGLVVMRSLRRLLWTRATSESPELEAYCKAQREARNALRRLRKKAAALEQSAASSAREQGAKVSAPFRGLEDGIVVVEQHFERDCPENLILYADSQWKRHRDQVCSTLAVLQVPSEEIESLFKVYAESTRQNRKTERNKERRAQSPPAPLKTGG